MTQRGGAPFPRHMGGRWGACPLSSFDLLYILSATYFLMLAELSVLSALAMNLPSTLPQKLNRVYLECEIIGYDKITYSGKRKLSESKLYERGTHLRMYVYPDGKINFSVNQHITNDRDYDDGWTLDRHYTHSEEYFTGSMIRENNQIGMEDVTMYTLNREILDFSFTRLMSLRKRNPVLVNGKMHDKDLTIFEGEALCSIRPEREKLI